MDPLIAAAARALSAGDPLGALKRIALRTDASGLALRGIAMAQLGELARAKELLRRAARAFGSGAPAARARCVVAEAEIALVSRDLRWPEKALAAARETLEAHGDRLNAAHARHLEIRRLVLIGRLEEAERTLAIADAASLPPALRAAYELVLAGIAMRCLRARPARAALARAARAAYEAGIPGLTAEVESAQRMLEAPAACLIVRDAERLVKLEEVEALLASQSLVIDACRHVVRDHRAQVSLVRRPVLFRLARALGEAWPGDTTRDELVARAFRLRLADESHRGRLRVELARLRKALEGTADVTATRHGFVLAPRRGREVIVLAPPSEARPQHARPHEARAPEARPRDNRSLEDKHASVLALLADGEAWSSSALALALGASARTVQRALDALAATGKVQSLGRGRTRRWITSPMPGFTTPLLLPSPLPID